MSDDVRRMPKHKEVLRDGGTSDHLFLIVEGWAARYKVVASGARQITAFLIPGDFCNLSLAAEQPADQGVVTLTQARVAVIPKSLVNAATKVDPHLTRSLWSMALLDAAVVRAWLINVGRRDAYGRVAHLFCELHTRLSAIGMVERDSFELPITQEQLADTLGITPVHTNRVIQRLRSDGLISLTAGKMTLLNKDRLAALAGFDPAYLQPGI
jgi:CRP-like cAMP-binding protein